MKTSELTGAALNWAVAKCDKPEWLGNQAEIYVIKAGFSPSTQWSQGGPIIEREGMGVGMVNEHWQAHLSEFGLWEDGPTPLIAAMRCYVASKLGDEVEIPFELI